MGIIDGEIQVISDELDVAATKTVKKMLDADSENVTIIYGQGASEQDAKQIEEFALKQDSELEVEIHQGDQPVYPLIVAVE